MSTTPKDLDLVSDQMVQVLQRTKRMPKLFFFDSIQEKDHVEAIDAAWKDIKKEFDELLAQCKEIHAHAATKAPPKKRYPDMVPLSMNARRHERALSSSDSSESDGSPIMTHTIRRPRESFMGEFRYESVHECYYCGSEDCGREDCDNIPSS
jgi:hypothetical protein